MTAPTVHPLARADVAAPDTYQPGDEVWVSRGDTWYPGEVHGSSTLAVLVRYRDAAGGHTDTVAAPFVLRRDGDA